MKFFKKEKQILELYEDIKGEVNKLYESLKDPNTPLQGIMVALGIRYYQFLNLAGFVKGSEIVSAEFKVQIKSGVFGHGRNSAYPGQLNMIAEMIRSCALQNGVTWQPFPVDNTGQAQLTIS